MYARVSEGGRRATACAAALLRNLIPLLHLLVIRPPFLLCSSSSFFFASSLLLPLLLHPLSVSPATFCPFAVPFSSRSLADPLPFHASSPSLALSCSSSRDPHPDFKRIPASLSFPSPLLCSLLLSPCVYVRRTLHLMRARARDHRHTQRKGGRLSGGRRQRVSEEAGGSSGGRFRRINGGEVIPVTHLQHQILD